MRRVLVTLLITFAVVALFAFTVHVEHAPLPAMSRLASARAPLTYAYDVMGRKITAAEATELQKTEEGRRLLSPAAGAIAVDEKMVRAGREAFYRETFGNEYFLTDVMGILDGPVTPWAVTKAVLALAGRGTTNLQVRLAKPITIGGRRYEKGELFSTGLDVVRGSIFPLGLKTVYDRGTIRVGITCAACHATIDAASGRVIEGAPNADFDVGTMMAMATNSSSYFVHVDIPSLDPFRTDPARVVRTSTGATERLPDPDALEAAVDAMVAAWGPGRFDSQLDLVNNPTSIPDTFARGAHPFGWSGFSGIGPFSGLSALTNNVHSLNSDETAQAAAAPALWKMDPEVYLGTLLQRAANKRVRYVPGEDRKPSEVLAAFDPTPESPGLNSYAVLPNYPRPNLVTTNGLIT
ncbi:MAG: hypothetical protein QOD74_1038, partial [Variibacter sp.]|nr:hypothetical protein [Variibacter sp.]